MTRDRCEGNAAAYREEAARYAAAGDIAGASRATSWAEWWQAAADAAGEST